MPEMERALRALAVELAWPVEPDLRAAVVGQLPAPAARRPPLRPLALAFAALVAALAVAMAVPPARSAILDFFGIGGVEIRRVETLPPAREDVPLALGRRVTLGQARAAADFAVRVPDVDAADIYLDRSIPGGRVSFVWDGLVLTQFQGEQLPFIRKFVGPQTQVQRVTVTGREGVWIEGEPHVVVYRDRTGSVREHRRLAGNVLIWEAGGLTFRLEGARSLRQALGIAGTLERREG